jgi:hypothetical protein
LNLYFSVNFFNGTTESGLNDHLECYIEASSSLYQDSDFLVYDLDVATDEMRVLVATAHASTVLELLTSNTSFLCSSTVAEANLTLARVTATTEAPCFGGDERIRMADGSVKAFRELMTGM